MRQKKKKIGMTLIEVMVSLAIVAVILLGFITMFSGGFKNIIITGKRTKAAEEARRIMEVITEKSSYMPEDYTQASIEGIIAGTGTSYNVQLIDFQKNYAPVDGATSATMCRITIKVLYDNNKNYVTLTSLINQ